MVRRFFQRTTYANAVSTLALFIVLGGSAYAAAALPANSVGRKQIKNNAVDTSKVRNGSLTGEDIKETALAKVPAAAVADGLAKVTYKTVAAVAPARGGNNATAACDAGQRVVGGGVKVDDPVNAFIIDGYPEAGGTGWTGRVFNAGTANVGFTVYAVCTTFTSAG
jgi:hypothetical protein